MRVPKIIQANPEIFDLDQNRNYTDIEAIRNVASMECKGNKIQQQEFEIRQTHTAIGNLLSLGYIEEAIELAVDILPKAEYAQQYKIALDLCDTLINYYYQVDDLDSVDKYKTLYDKFSSSISYEHETMLLLGSAAQNQKKLKPLDLSEVQILLAAVEQKLPYDSSLYHYYFYLFKSFTLDGDKLEKLYLEAIDYFKELYHNHTSLSGIFREKLIAHYLHHNFLVQAEKHLQQHEAGSIPWFRSYFAYTQKLISLNDLKSNDICIMTMNHPNFINLPNDLKEQWRVVYKASVRQLLDS